MDQAGTKYRINQFLKYKGIGKSRFYQEMGIKRGLLDTDKMQASVSDSVLAKMVTVYPDLSPLWLLAGEGEMTHSSSTEPIPSLEQYPPAWDTRQLVPTDRHYLLYPQENGFEYEIVDALIVCSRVSRSGVVYKSFGVNMTGMGLGDGWTLGQYRNSILADFLDTRRLEKMVSFLMNTSLFSRKEALREIRLDFQQTRVRISPVVRQMLSDVD